MPLAEMYRTMLEATNPATWETNRQKQLMGEYELESKRRAMEAEQQLRQLYAENPNPSFGAAAAISPEYAQKMQQFQNDQLLKQMQTQDLMQKQQEYQAKTYAQYMGPLADTYFDDLRSGMKPEMALQKFRSAVGTSQKELEEKHGIRPQADFTQFSPEQILDRTTGLGVPSRHYKAREEEEKTRLGIQMKQTPGAGEMQQEYIVAPDGVTLIPKPNRYLQPPMSRGPMPQSQGGYQEQAPYQFTAPSGQKIMAYDLGSAAQALHELPEGPDKEAAAKWLDEQWQSKRTAPKTRQELAIEEETGKERAKLKVQDEQDAENKLSTIASMPSDEDLMKYLNDATVGKGEEILKGPVASFFHVENKAQAADTVLGVLQENIKNIATKAKGDMNIQEVKNYESAVGALNNKDLGPQARFQAYLAAKNMVIKKIAMKHPEIAKKYGMGTATQAGNQQSQIPEPKTVEEARKLPKGTVFKVPGTGQLKIVD